LFEASDLTADASVAADLEFHRALGEATQNPYFVQFLTAISDRIAHVILAARADKLIASNRGGEGLGSGRLEQLLMTCSPDCSHSEVESSHCLADG
jgi:hypothetical protein